MIEETGKDNIAFEEAKKAGTISSYENYLKKHKIGRFIADAQKEIKALKDKIRKETKIKFTVSYIKFFNKKIGKPGEPSLRKYKNSFKKLDTNFIFTEIKLLNKFYKIDDFTTKIYIEYKNIETNLIFKTKVKNFVQKNDLSNFIYTTGMGWKEKGIWTKGKYLISIFMDGIVIGKQSFILE